MTHNLMISVSKEPRAGSVVSCKKVTMREKMLTRLFGQKQKLMVLIPGNSVRTVSIVESKEGGENGE